MKILISGSRYTIQGHETKISEILDQYNPKTDTILHGGATGVDTIAGKLAKFRGFTVIPIKADWKKHGPKAGPIRNQQMIENNPDIAYFFPYPSLKESKGTYDTYKRATQKGIKTIVIDP
jgi:hypothetical protein